MLLLVQLERLPTENLFSRFNSGHCLSSQRKFYQTDRSSNFDKHIFKFEDYTLLSRLLYNSTPLTLDFFNRLKVLFVENFDIDSAKRSLCHPGRLVAKNRSRVRYAKPSIDKQFYICRENLNSILISSFSYCNPLITQLFDLFFLLPL